jgi:hypothetical protein
MPRFYFNFLVGGALAKDDQGTDFPGLEEAKAMGITSIRQLLADDIKAAKRKPVEVLIVTDESGRELHTIHARDVLPERMK